MQAVLSQITFYEAFFKVHHTKGFRLTYPMPLPTSVAGIFGAMLGIDRTKMKDEFCDMLFGSGLLKYDGLVIENETFIQYKKTQIRKGVFSDAIQGVVHTQLVNHPTYIIAMAGPPDKIAKYHAFLAGHRMVYLPYGGQNDFFIENFEIKDVTNVLQSDIVSNYAPQDMVSKLESSDTVLSILPVMHTYSDNPNFYFVLKGQLRLKRPVNVASDSQIALYPLEKFKIV